MHGLEDALRLVAIADLATCADRARLAGWVRGGVTAVWLRAHEASGAELHRAAEAVTRAIGGHAALIVGDRVDVALAVGAQGVHLGFRAPPASAMRRVFPGWLGVSCHSAEELDRASRASADYVTLSPVFATPGKLPPLGVEGFARLTTRTGLPVVALGGIDADNAGGVLRAGAAGVAAIRSLRDASDPESAARALRDA